MDNMLQLNQGHPHALFKNVLLQQKIRGYSFHQSTLNRE